jgi:hypothetical protein
MRFQIPRRPAGQPARTACADRLKGWRGQPAKRRRRQGKRATAAACGNPPWLFPFPA